MTVRAIDADPAGHAGPLLAIPVFQDEPLSGATASVDALLGGAITRVLEAGDIQGRPEQSALLYNPGDTGPRRVVAIGMGPRDQATAESVRRLAGSAVRVAEACRLDSVAVVADGPGDMDDERLGQAAAEGGALAAWQFLELKTEEGRPEDALPPLPVTDLALYGGSDPDAFRRGVETGTVIAEAENLARTLQARPGNVATPTHLAEVAGQIAGEEGLDFRALGPQELLEEGMRTLLAVSQGSAQEPRLIVMEHHGGAEGDPPLVLVGKGLTFDAGGISIKPAKGMEEMKFDMSGGAAVIAAMRAIARLRVPLNVVGIVPSSENLLGSRAVKPGDVVRTREGKTVEIVNTDAEGRLILADALSFAQEYRPAAIVDCATLTGSVVIALGHAAIGLMGSDEGLVQELIDAGERSGERCWQLPLWDDYRKQLESTTADFMNVGGRPAGSITAAWFLREFVGEIPWGHLDVAGTAWGEGERSYHRKGGYGLPTRLLVEWVRSRAG